MVKFPGLNPCYQEKKTWNIILIPSQSSYSPLFLPLPQIYLSDILVGATNGEKTIFGENLKGNIYFLSYTFLNWRVFFFLSDNVLLLEFKIKHKNTCPSLPFPTLLYPFLILQLSIQICFWNHIYDQLIIKEGAKTIPWGNNYSLSNR